MKTVYLHRKPRDGTETSETMPEWLALATIANIPSGEPLTASAWVRPFVPQIATRPRQSAVDLALAMAGAWDSTRQETVQ